MQTGNLLRIERMEVMSISLIISSLLLLVIIKGDRKREV